MLQKVNQILEKMMPLITPLSVLIGVVLATFFIHFTEWVPWIFAFMTFTGALSSSFQSLKRAITNPVPMLVVLFILHFFMPAWAWGIGHLVFENDPLTITGLILAVIIPTGITSFIWVSMKQGNITLTLSVILIDTMISPFIVPYSLTFFTGGNVEMDIWSMMKGLFFMIVLPSILGMVVNHLMKGKSKEILTPKLAPFSKIGLALVVMINSAEVAPFLLDINRELILIAGGGR